MQLTSGASLELLVLLFRQLCLLPTRGKTHRQILPSSAMHVQAHHHHTYAKTHNKQHNARADLDAEEPRLGHARVEEFRQGVGQVHVLPGEMGVGGLVLVHVAGLEPAHILVVLEVGGVARRAAEKKREKEKKEVSKGADMGMCERLLRALTYASRGR